MANIALINPSITPEEMYGKLSGVGSTEPNLGLCYLASYLREQGHVVRIIDAQVLLLTEKEVIQQLARFHPDVIGVTSVTLAMDIAGRLGQALKKAYPNTPLILGGVHITALPEETMDRHVCFDIGVLGEGEITFTELVYQLVTKQEINNVNGIIYHNKTELIKTAPREYVKDLDIIPMPAWDLLTGFPHLYHTPATACNNSPSTSIVTTRGCGAKCTFCFQGAMGRICRGHSAQRIIEMITHLYENYGIRDIRILDDIFVANRPRLKEVCNTLIDLNLDLSWSCYARIDTINEELLSLMKKAGCWQISYGIESGCQELLDLVKKNIELEQIRKVISITKKAGIRSLGYFMIGFPQETSKTIEQTIRFACSLELDDFKMNFLTPFPGSELYKIAEEYGSFNKNWNKMNMYVEPAFIPTGISKQQLIKAKKRAFRKFYLRPRIIFSYLSGIRNPAHIKKLVLGAFSLLKYWLSK